MILKALRYKVAHVAVIEIHAKFSGDRGGPQCPDKGAQQITSFFSSKYILATKKGIFRNDKFDSFFSRCTTVRF